MRKAQAVALIDLCESTDDFIPHWHISKKNYAFISGCFARIVKVKLILSFYNDRSITFHFINYSATKLETKKYYWRMQTVLLSYIVSLEWDIPNVIKCKCVTGSDGNLSAQNVFPQLGLVWATLVSRGASRFLPFNTGFWTLQSNFSKVVTNWVTELKE